MPTPSNIKQTKLFQPTTEDHDLLALWLFNEDNKKKICKFVSESDLEGIDNSKIESKALKNNKDVIELSEICEEDFITATDYREDYNEDDHKYNRPTMYRNSIKVPDGFAEHWAINRQPENTTSDKLDSFDTFTAGRYFKSFKDPDVKIFQVRNELPIFGSNKYLIGSVDSIIDYAYIFPYDFLERVIRLKYKLTKYKTCKKWEEGELVYDHTKNKYIRGVTVVKYNRVFEPIIELQCITEEIKTEYIIGYTNSVIIDFKPKMDSIGSLMSQLNAYYDYLKYECVQRHGINLFRAVYISKRLPKKCVITLDTNTKFDEYLLKENNTYVYHVDRSEV